MDSQVIGLMLGAAALGLRHGIDWDHLAAIFDIAGSSGNRGAMWTAFLYAVGHAGSVLTLGFLALQFATLLPAWIDPIVQRVVGCTLLLLGAAVLWSLYKWWQHGAHFQLSSRWMILSKVMENIAGRFGYKINPAGNASAFTIGVVHGIGAETGSQVLLIAALGNGVGHLSGIAMMLAFIVGLVTSNMFVAFLAVNGIISTERWRPLYIGTGFMVACFSILVGLAFLTGMSDRLPELAATQTHG